MYSQLGAILFDVAKSFAGISKTSTATYAEHNVIDGKAKLQFTGEGLDELKLQIRLHAAFCNPQQELNALKQAKSNGEVMSLLWGNGTVEGDFVITEVSNVFEEQFADGSVICYNLDLSLKEIVIADRLKNEQEAARRDAVAVGDKQPVSKPRTNTPTCAKQTAELISNIESHCRQVNVIVVQKGGMNSEQNTNAIQNHCEAIKNDCGVLIERGQSPDSCVSEHPAIVQNAYQVRSNAADTAFAESAVDLLAKNRILQSSFIALKASANVLITKSITRNG